MCHVKAGGIHITTIIVVCLLYQKIIAYRNNNAFWNIIIFLANLQNSQNKTNYQFHSHKIYYKCHTKITNFTKYKKKFKAHLVFTRVLSFLG